MSGVPWPFRFRFKWCATVFAAAATVASTGAAEFFVAPEGVDTNPGPRAAPFTSFRAAQQAARNDDYLSRQQRVMRKRFQLVCTEVEVKLQRQLLSSERDAIASDIATGRPDLISFLVVGSHPQEFAEETLTPYPSNLPSLKFP